MSDSLENVLAESLGNLSLEPNLNIPIARSQRRGREISQVRRHAIHSLRAHAGWTIRRSAQQLNIPRSTIHRLSHQSQQGRFKPKKRSGRPRIVTPIIRQKLVSVATATAHNRRLPYASLSALIGVRMSPAVVGAALQEEGFHRRVACQKPFLTPAQKSKRFNWALEHAHWGVEEWRRVIWTDEAAFNVGGTHGRIWVTRRPGEEYSEDCLIPKFKKLSLLMVWGAISGIGGRLSLVFWDKKNWGRITAQKYRDKIFFPHLLPIYRRERLFWGDPLMIMEDNASVHNARLMEAARNMHLLPRLPWPAVSPDLNPIEKVWRCMKEEISSLPTRPNSKEDMEDAIWSIWSQLGNEEIQAIVDSMPLRIQAVLAAQGGHTHY